MDRGRKITIGSDHGDAVQTNAGGRAMIALIDFENLLKQKIGLDVASVGPSTIARAVKERMRVCRLHDEQVYWERLQSSETELQELVETVVIPETWFFRDPE